MNRIGRWITVLLPLGVMGFAGLYLSGALSSHASSKTGEPKGKEAPPPRVIPVTVERVTPRPVQRRVAIVGSLYGREEVVIAPKVEGRIHKIHHDVGDVVKPGTILLELEDTDFQLAVTEAQRGLDLELAKVGLKSPPGENFDVKKLPSVVRADALFRNATNKRERIQRLIASNAVSTEDRDLAETEYTVAEANYRGTVFEAETTLASIRHRQTMLETARQHLADTKIRVPTPSIPADTGERGKDAPLQGPVEYVVAQRFVSEGEMVRIMGNAGAQLFKLVIDNPLKLQATVPERYLGDVRVGQSVELRVEAFPNEIFMGKVARVNPTVERANRTFQVEVHTPNPNRRLRAGSFTKAAILTHVESAAPTVPEEALVRFAGVVKIYLVQDGVAKSVQVQPRERLEIAGPTRGRHWVEVAGTVVPGAQVVTTGHSQLVDGSPVRIRDAQPATNQP